jgi:hypothetical protein
MTRTLTALRQMGWVGLASLTLVGTAPALLAPASANHTGPATTIDLGPNDSASVGTCGSFVITVSAGNGARVENQVVDVVLTERTASAGQDLDFCTGVTGSREPQAPAAATDTGTAGTTDRAQFTTGAEGTVVIGVVASERGTADIAAFVDANNDDVRQATEIQDVSVLFVSPGGAPGSQQAANAVQCVDARGEADTDYVGEPHVVLVTLTNHVVVHPTTGAETNGGLVADRGTGTCAGDTVAGVTPSVVVTGVNAGAAVRCTPSSNAGQATCSYPGTRAGNDTVLVFVNQTDGAGGPGADANEPKDTVTRASAAAPTGLQVALTCQTAGTSPEDCDAALPAGRTNGSAVVVATVVRRAGNGAATPVQGAIVRFTENGADATVATGTAAGTAGLNGATTTDATECVTAANGTCSATLTERTPVGGESLSVTATIRGQDPAGDAAQDPATPGPGEISSDTGTVTFRNAVRDARFVDLRPEGPMVTASGGVRELTALVTDTNGSPVRGVQVTFTETGAGAFRTGTSSVAVTTNAAGIAAVDVVSQDRETGDQQVTATITSAGTQCSASAGAGGTNATPSPAAGTCADTELNTFTTGPAPSPSPTPGPACSTAASTRVSPATITAGRPSDVTVTSTTGRTVRLWAYSRPSTTFRVVREVVATGSTTVWRVYPATNTRLYAQEVGCTASASVVLSVRSAIGISAVRNGPRVYTFTGPTNPRRPGQIVSLFRRTASGDVLTAQARTGSDGRYTIQRRFTGSGSFDVFARTSTDMTSLQGTSLLRRTLIF